MSYTTLMVHLELGRPNAGLLNITADLARRLGAGVIGIALRQPLPMVYADGYVPAELIAQDRIDTAREAQSTEAEFRSALGGHTALLQWRFANGQTNVAAHLARESRSADLVIAGAASGDLFDSSWNVNRGGLALQAGRPVLMVPVGCSSLPLAHAMVAWKESREARRAVADALPLLRLAARVSIVEIAADANLAAAREHVADVAAWLGRHGIAAQASARASTASSAITTASKNDDAVLLGNIATDENADLIVAGAYGHSRLREWVFGGVTHDLLLSGSRCALVSH